MLITDRDFVTAMRQHGLDWLADRIALDPSIHAEEPPQKLDKVRRKPGPKKGTKYKPRKKKTLATADGASGTRQETAATGIRPPGEVGRQDGCQEDEVRGVDNVPWESAAAATEEAQSEEPGLDFVGEADHVLDELIGMYESQHGELPTNDAIRSWMTTLQEATATSALASGVLASGDRAVSDDETGSPETGMFD